jgi:hypothetical protein
MKTSFSDYKSPKYKTRSTKVRKNDLDKSEKPLPDDDNKNRTDLAFSNNESNAGDSTIIQHSESVTTNLPKKTTTKIKKNNQRSPPRPHTPNPKPTKRMKRFQMFQ